MYKISLYSPFHFVEKLVLNIIWCIFYYEHDINNLLIYPHYRYHDAKLFSCLCVLEKWNGILQILKWNTFLQAEVKFSGGAARCLLVNLWFVPLLRSYFKPQTDQSLKSCLCCLMKNKLHFYVLSTLRFKFSFRFQLFFLNVQCILSYFISLFKSLWKWHAKKPG